MQNYALIIGHGRSGTNWLLNILDVSPHTFCRNEPNEVKDSPFGKITPLWQVGESQPDLDEHWDEIAAWLGSHMGDRDHRLNHPKTYVSPLSQKLGLATVTARPKVRKAVRKVSESLWPGEWQMPWWVGDQDKLTQSYAIFKINQAARVAVWVLNNRPQAPVFHIVRHPGGRLNSWLKRFLATRDKALIAERNRKRLRRVLNVSPEWTEQFGDIDAMTIFESEMWFWRYVTEQIHQVGEGKPNYKLLLYENLAYNPVGLAQEVFEFCGLPWNDDVADRIRAETRESPWGKIQGSPMTVAQAWRDRLKPKQIEAVNKVLTGSMMEQWWDE